MTTKRRNIGISAHVDAGKTTLTERILYYTGRIHQMGEVHSASGATMDHDSLEAAHGITISSAVTQVTWKDHTLNIIDTPGHVDFTVEVERSLRVLDGAVLVLCAVGGVQSQSLTVDRQMKRYQVPRVAFINKMDRSGADPDRVVQELADKLQTTPVVLQYPVGTGGDFNGVIDLLTMQWVQFQGEHGERVMRSAIPDELSAAAETARQRMLDTLSLFDDEIMRQLLQDETPSAEQLQQVIRNATLGLQVTPVVMGSAYHNQGVQELLDAVTFCLPSPEEREVYANDNTASESAQLQRKLTSHADDPVVAMAFKTVVESFGQLTYLRVYQGTIRKGDSLTNARTGRSVRFRRLVRLHAGQREEIACAVAGDIVGVMGVDCASGDTFHSPQISCSLENIFVPDPVVELSITPIDPQSASTLAKALDRFRRQDPTFRVTADSLTGETLISGMGQLHLDLYVERLRDEFDCLCETGAPRVAWRQRPTVSVEFNHRLSKQSGGPGQFGHIIGHMEPLSEDTDQRFEFVDEVKGGRIPREYIPAIRKGFEDALHSGPAGDFEVVGVKVVLTDGTFHEQDSSDKAFRDCARDAMRTQILPHAGVVVLEPFMRLQLELPEEFQGRVTGHLISSLGMVTSSTTVGGVCSLVAEAPLSQLFDYATQLRSLTQGQGSFRMELLGYRRTSQAHVIA
ncbi:MAG: elongation factor G [Planctomycetaceae bacterium]|nr:elongation factor G [Planctomycetaceae bacterium]